MNIVVCIKHVPDTAHLKYDAQDNLAQDNLEWVMNPFCEYAVETAIRMKEAHEGATLTAICMGGPQAKDILKRAIAMGCDDAVLLQDDAFNGADPWATAQTLAAGIRKHVPNFNVLLLGQFATDSMSGVTGPALAELLGVPSITFCKKAELKDATTLSVERETERGSEHYDMTLPGVVCVMKCDYEPRIPAIKGVMKANRTEIPTLDKAALGLSDEQIGAKGARVEVTKLYRRPKKEGGRKIDGSDAQAAVSQLMSFLREQKLV
jgi:electron transfer flavoprotein beta subunit